MNKEKLAKELQALCNTYSVPFIVNDDVSLAKRINADGIHVGQDDEAVRAFSNDFQDKIIGLSVVICMSMKNRISLMLITSELDQCLKRHLKVMLMHL